MHTDARKLLKEGYGTLPKKSMLFLILSFLELAEELLSSPDVCHSNPTVRTHLNQWKTTHCLVKASECELHHMKPVLSRCQNSSFWGWILSQSWCLLAVRVPATRDYRNHVRNTQCNLYVELASSAHFETGHHLQLL